MPSKTKNATHDDEDRCPNCGYCPHCGQSTKPPQIIREVVRPAPRPYYPWQEWRPEIGRPYYTWTSTASKGIKAEHLSIDHGNEYASRKETEC